MSGSEGPLSNLELQPFIVEVDGEERVEVDTDGKRHTVELREPADFEDELVDSLVLENKSGDGVGGRLPIKGRWIEGWLEKKGEDYINSIYKNYQFFLKYLEGKTERISNTSTYKRSPGTYESMYRYILILEDLNLVERHRRETIPASAYDNFVPEEMRRRTYVKKVQDYEEAPGKWDNPHNARYGEGAEIEVDTEDEESEEVSIEIEPEDTEDVESDDTESSEEFEGLDSFTAEEEISSISEFDDTFGLASYVDGAFSNSIKEVVNNPPVDIDTFEADDYSLKEVAVVREWNTGEAIEGETPLSLVISVEASSNANKPRFIPSNLTHVLNSELESNNKYEETFPSYNVTSVYSDAFIETLEEVMLSDDSYFSLLDEERKEL